MRRLTAAAACASTLCIAAQARADDASTFETGQAAYDAGQYAQAEILFAKMLDGKNPPCSAPGSPGPACKLTDPPFIERARSLAAASLVVLKRFDEADAIFEQILINNPTWEPNFAVYPVPAQQRFTEVRRRLKPRLDQMIAEQQTADQARALGRQKAKEEYEKWIQEIQRRAAQDRTQTVNSRLVALLPFGIGQFQNRDNNLGIVFATSELVAGGASIVGGLLASHYGGINQYKPISNDQGALVSCEDPCKAQLASNLSTSLAVNRWSFAAWAGLTAGGILQAQIAFREKLPAGTTPRPLPPAPQVQPTFAVLPGGAFLGARGSF